MHYCHQGIRVLAVIGIDIMFQDGKCSSGDVFDIDFNLKPLRRQGWHERHGELLRSESK